MRIAVIGAGSIGARHVRDLLSLGERDIHVFDYDTAQQERLIIENQVAVYATLRDLYLAQPQAVIICTPPECHVGQALEAARNVCHVFIEKPLSTTLEGVGIIEHLLNERSMTGHVASPLRYHAGPLAIKRWLADGALGDVLSARFFCGYHLPGVRPDYATSYVATTGALLDIGWHETDLALHWFGPVARQAAIVRPATSIGLEIDGLAELSFQHESGMVSSIGVSWLTPGYLRYILVNGTEGRALWSWHGGDTSEIVLYGEQGGIINDRQIVSPIDDMYRAELAAFLQAVREGHPSPNPLANAVKVLTLLLRAKTG